jgi:hypothetical protein
LRRACEDVFEPDHHRRWPRLDALRQGRDGRWLRCPRLFNGAQADRERHVADEQRIAVAERHRTLDWLIVEPGAVLAAEVLDEVVVALAAEARMLARNRAVRQHHHARRQTTDLGRALGDVPLFGRQLGGDAQGEDAVTHRPPRRACPVGVA